MVLKIRAVPGASRERIVGPLGDALKVAVTAAPERGKANQAILALLATELQLPRHALSLIGGETSRDKRVLIKGVDRSILADRLTALLA